MDDLIEMYKPLPQGVTLRLPEHMRDELRRPLGPVVQEGEVLHMLRVGNPLATVGDMTTATLHRLGRTIQLAVVDYQTKRSREVQWAEATAPVGEITLEVRNDAATISSSLYNAVLEGWTSERTVKIVVEGEEDLAALPAILHAPEGATVIYGIPDMGLCLVHVDEGARGFVHDAMRRFDRGTGQAPP
jgi:uncharacterized protein (UPF0218 family)